MFGLHFEPMCHEAQEIGIYVSKEINSKIPHMHAPIHDIHMLIMLTHMIQSMLMCTLVHIVDVRATLQSFVKIEYIM